MQWPHFSDKDKGKENDSLGCSFCFMLFKQAIDGAVATTLCICNAFMTQIYLQEGVPSDGWAKRRKSVEKEKGLHDTTENCYGRYHNINTPT